MKFVLIGTLASALLCGADAMRINELIQKESQSIAQSEGRLETDAEMEARLGLMTRVTISNTKKSLKMDRNHAIAKNIAQAMAEAIRAQRRAESAMQEAKEEEKEIKEKEKENAETEAEGGKNPKKSGTEGKYNAAESEAAEADKMAAEASKDKADKLMKLAKAKVKSIVDNYKELDTNL